MEKTPERSSSDLTRAADSVNERAAAESKSALSRRDALRIIEAGAVAGTLVTSGCQVRADKRIAIEHLDNVKLWIPVLFTFPDDLPAILLDVGEAVGGVGPRQSIVAFSAVCTHMGCTVQLNTSLEIRGRMRHLVCPCHISAFDPGKFGSAIAGPATYGLPIIELEISGGTIYATGIRPGRPVFGHPLAERRS